MNPLTPELLFGQADACIGRRRYRQALGHLEQALALDPDDPETRFRLALVLTQASHPGQAVRVLDGLRQDHPGWPGLNEAMAAALRRDARYEDAVAAAAGDSDQLLYERGMALTALSRGAEALAAFDRLLARDPDFAASWFNSHAAALELNGPDDAMDRLRRALACKGANGKYWGHLEALLRLSGRTKEADTLYAGRLAGHPKRLALPDSVRAVLPHARPGCRLFGLSAPLLRHALDQASRPGLVLEFGVRRGTSLRVLAQAAGQEVHGFDSFEGLPESWGSEPAGVLTTGQELPEVPANAHLHAGWFQDSLPPFLAVHPGPVRLVNIDSDIYSSARFVLEQLTGRLGPGAVVVFDEFIGNRSWAEDEYRAWMEWAGATGARWEVFAINPCTKQVAIRLLP